MNSIFTAWVTTAGLLLAGAAFSQTNTFPSTGDVGIGTTTPGAYLHVKGPGGQPAFRISNDTYKTDFIQDGYVSTIRASANFSLFCGAVASPSEMRLDGVSNAKFYLSGPYGAFVNGFGGFKVGMQEKIGFFTYGSTGQYGAIGAVYQDNNNIGLSFFTRYGGVSAEAARFSKAGSLLIGTTTDNDNKLQVNGNIWSTGLVLPTDAAAGKVLTSDANGAATWQTPAAAGWSYNGDQVGTLKGFGTTDNYALPFITNNVERMRIGANGNVGIGTVDITDAGYHLFVEKGIRTRKVKVDVAAWADYVFDDSYNLRPLPELEKFIQANSRLPEVPSKDQVIKEGVDLGGNQVLLLKKIEELTLYIISLEKRISLLEGGHTDERK